LELRREERSGGKGSQVQRYTFWSDPKSGQTETERDIQTHRLTDCEDRQSDSRQAGRQVCCAR
jgi:hypothetical protein